MVQYTLSDKRNSEIRILRENWASVFIRMNSGTERLEFLTATLNKPTEIVIEFMPTPILDD